MNTLTSPRTVTTLEKLYTLAEEARKKPRSSAQRQDIAAMSPAERADALADAYMPISPEGGRLLYALTRAARPTTVVEFGTSYGLSTIHLAAAVADNGAGQVWATELSATKVAAARANLDEAGVGEQVTVLEGDALETLQQVDGPIGVVLLDGWKDLYLPVLKLIEDRLEPGALVIADNTSFDTVAAYLSYVENPANGYVTVDLPVAEGMSISSRAA